MTTRSNGNGRHTVERVGPVLESGTVGDAVIAAIRRLNAEVLVQDQGSYKRVLVPRRCILTVEAAEEELGRPFALPWDLERIMPSFKGRLALSAERAEWSWGQGPTESSDECHGKGQEDQLCTRTSLARAETSSSGPDAMASGPSDTPPGSGRGAGL